MPCTSSTSEAFISARVAIISEAGWRLSHRVANGSTTPVNTMNTSSATANQTSKLPKIRQARRVTSTAASGGMTTRR